MGSLYLRACACSAEVKKPCGKKKAETQNDLGELDQLALHLVDHHVGVHQLVDAARVVRNLAGHALALLLEHRGVQVEQLEVRGRRGVNLAPQLAEKVVGGAADRVVHLDADVADRRLGLVRADVDLLKVALGHREQRVLGPGVEPVNRAAVDERREHAAPHAEGLADRGHAEDDVEVLLDLSKTCQLQARHSRAQHRTAQHSTARGTAQHSARHSAQEQCASRLP